MTRQHFKLLTFKFAQLLPTQMPEPCSLKVGWPLLVVYINATDQTLTVESGIYCLLSAGLNCVSFLKQMAVGAYISHCRLPLRLLVHSATSSWACSPRISLEVLRVHIRAFERCIDNYQLHPDGDFSHDSTLRSIFEESTVLKFHYPFSGQY
ncbi:hypothetical protein B0H14DRAFT_2569684 [Mycena olivaceomarginata]|nr:hypothetical protein B0H14DRAFT_2569684 [Mycena olivaceomarginata]